MENGTRKYAVLAVSRSEKFSAALRALLPAGRYDPLVTVSGGREAKERLSGSRFDIAIINDPLPDLSGEALATEVCRDSGAGVLL